MKKQSRNVYLYIGVSVYVQHARRYYSRVCETGKEWESESERGETEKKMFFGMLTVEFVFG